MTDEARTEYTPTAAYKRGELDVLDWGLGVER